MSHAFQQKAPGNFSTPSPYPKLGGAPVTVLPGLCEANSLLDFLLDALSDARFHCLWTRFWMRDLLL